MINSLIHVGTLRREPKFNALLESDDCFNRAWLKFIERFRNAADWFIIVKCRPACGIFRIDFPSSWTYQWIFASGGVGHDPGVHQDTAHWESERGKNVEKLMKFPKIVENFQPHIRLDHDHPTNEVSCTLRDLRGNLKCGCKPYCLVFSCLFVNKNVNKSRQPLQLIYIFHLMYREKRLYFICTHLEYAKFDLHDRHLLCWRFERRAANQHFIQQNPDRPIVHLKTKAYKYTLITLIMSNGLELAVSCSYSVVTANVWILSIFTNISACLTYFL